MEKERLHIVKKQYLAAMSLEMKSPLQKIIQSLSDSSSSASKREADIKEAARYLQTLVDELADFARM